MLSQERIQELKSAVKYNPNSKPNPILKTIRSFPALYSCICKIRRFLSKKIANRENRKVFKDSINLFEPNEFEQTHIDNLKKQGYTVINNFFSDELINLIDEKADKLFKNLKINFSAGYNVSHGRIPTLDGFSYEEIEAFEQNIIIENPLLNISNVIEIFFNESILKIVTNYLGYVPEHSSLVMRNFPQDEPIEASNFHKDSDEHDVIQVFVHLIDIDGKRGPLTFVPNSHKHDVKSCIPRTNFDLGINENYGRISDKEVEKEYPRENWVTFYGKKATVAIVDVNGFHKGPNWDKFGDKENKYRDTIRVNFRGLSFEKRNKTSKNQLIDEKEVNKMSKLQKIFLKNYEIVK